MVSFNNHFNVNVKTTRYHNVIEFIKAGGSGAGKGFASQRTKSGQRFR